MKILRYLIGAAIALTAIACDESDDIGTSLVEDEVKIVVDTFTVTGESVIVPSIQSRTTTQLLGAINAEGYGQFSSDFVTQFMAAGAIDTVGVTAATIDSLQLVMAVPVGGFIGDSIAPMGLTVYELPQGTKLPSPIYSSFRPSEDIPGMKPIATKMYACNAIYTTDSVTNTAYRYIMTTLPLELGRRLYNAYVENPQAYLEPSTFSTIFPGLYVANSYGSGRVVKIAGTSMRIFYHSITKNDNGNDTIIHKTGTYYAVTPEVVTNNNISYAMSKSLTDMANSGEALIVAPTGINTQIYFPLPELIERFRDNGSALTVPNTLSLHIPAETITNNYGILPPPNLLLVLTSRKDQFFANNQVTDNVYSFFAAYSPENKSYTFTGMRDYLTTMLAKDEISPEDYTFTLVPVDITTENYGYNSTSVFISAITPYISTPSMARLRLADARVIFSYSLMKN